FQAEDGIRDFHVTGVQTCALPIYALGIPFYAGQRHLQRIAGGRVFVPRETADDFRALMSLHQKLEDTEYDIEIVGIGDGEVFARSEERRVGKEWRCGWVTAHGEQE